jgi:hypothetical protein
MKRLAYLLLVMVVTSVTSIVGFVACTGDRANDPKPTTQLPEATDAIDKELMIALSMAKNFHRKAKVYMSDGKLVEATASVREILSLRFPPNAPEAEDVRNDARALLSKLLVAQGQIEVAMTVVTEGIAHSQRESFFVANLYTAKGEVHMARADALDAKDPANKSVIETEKHEAILAFDKSNSINLALQQRLMEER